MKTQERTLPVSRKLVYEGSFSQDDADSNKANVNPEFYNWLFKHPMFVCDEDDRSKLFDSKIIFILKLGIYFRILSSWKQ